MVFGSLGAKWFVEGEEIELVLRGGAVLVVATVGGISLLSDTCAALCLSSCSLVALEGVDNLSSFRLEPDIFVLSEAKACDNEL